MLTLWSSDTLRTSRGPTVNERAMDLPTDPIYTQADIDDALVPMVAATAGHPAVVAWEFFNENEEMSDEPGWSFKRRVPMADIAGGSSTSRPERSTAALPAENETRPGKLV